MTPSVLLEFEARWPRHSGAKEEAIYGELGMPPARFYQLLSRAAKSREGIAADPITARRVRARGSGGRRENAAFCVECAPDPGTSRIVPSGAG